MLTVSPPAALAPAPWLAPLVQSSVSSIPKFLVRGRLNKTNCSLSAPFTGEITVAHSEAKIRSIELQLVRVETIGEAAEVCYCKGIGQVAYAAAVCAALAHFSSVCCSVCGCRPCELHVPELHFLLLAAAYAEGSAREATEIQNLQIGDGDVPRGLTIPLYMIFPRIFTCPTSIGDVSAGSGAW